MIADADRLRAKLKDAVVIDINVAKDIRNNRAANDKKLLIAPTSIDLAGIIFLIGTIAILLMLRRI